MSGKLYKAALAALSFFFLSATANAQNYPTRPITLVVGVTAGAAIDVTARVFAEFLGKELGQPVVVENRAGGFSLIGTNYVVRAAPDGYTLLWGTTDLTLGPSVLAAANYKMSDLTPISLITRTPIIHVAHPSTPFKSIDELVDYMKANPGKVKIGVSSTIARLQVAMLKEATKADFIEVGYKGGGDALTAVIAGEIDVVATSTRAAREMGDAGKVKVVGLLGSRRTPIFPEGPVYSDSKYENIRKIANNSGFGQSWYGVLAPANTPSDIVAKLNAASLAVTKNPEFVKKTEFNGEIVAGTSVEEFGKLLTDQDQEWKELTKRIGYVPQ